MDGGRTMRVLVWRRIWLPGSETFIRNQVDNLHRWRPRCGGMYRQESSLVRQGEVALFARRPRGPIGSLLNRFRLRWRIGSLVRESDPDLLHAHFALDAYDLVHLSQRHRIPLIVTAHGYDVTEVWDRRGLRGRWRRIQVSTALRRADLILAVSDHIRKQALAHGARPDRIIVHHIGIPIPSESATAVPKWDIVAVGRMVEKKGFADLLAALPLLGLSDVTDLRIAIIGDGPLRSSLEAAARTAGPVVEFMGAQSPDRVIEVMRESYMFVGPSKTASNGDSEGLPTTFVEAAACGLPIVAYRHSGVPEIVLDGVSGLLVDEGDVVALASAISRLLCDTNGARAMGAMGRLHAKENFDIRSQTSTLEDIYDQALEAYRDESGF